MPSNKLKNTRAQAERNIDKIASAILVEPSSPTGTTSADFIRDGRAYGTWVADTKANPIRVKAAVKRDTQAVAEIMAAKGFAYDGKRLES